MNGLDFDTCFDDEPGAIDPADDLARGRSRRRRGRVLVVGVTTTAAAAALAGTVLIGTGPTATPSAPPTAVPSPATPRTPTPTTTPAGDTVPELRWTKRTGYLDEHGGDAWVATTRNSWRLARARLDPSHRHLESYQEFAFTGGSAPGLGVEVGQKIGWTTRGDDGQGMVHLAVSRFGPGTRGALKTVAGEDTGLCWQESDRCAVRSVDGHRVYTADLDGGGFVLDVVQDDGELASIVVNPVFGNNTTVALKGMDLSRSVALALLLDPALDIVG